MSYYLDTNMCIYYLNGRYDAVRQHLLAHTPEEIRIPAIVKAELLAGAYKSSRRLVTEQKLLSFLSFFVLEPFGDRMTYAYAELRSQLEKNGTLIGPDDMLIAATVLAEDGILVTHNVREFQRVKGLRLEDWTA